MEAGSRRDGASRRILIIGEGEVSDACQRALEAAKVEVVRLPDPTDGEIHETLSEDFDTVLLLSEDDVVSLRRALVVEGLRPGEPMVVTVYGRSVAGKLQSAVRHARVMSMADIVAPALAGPCLEDRLLSVVRCDGQFRGVEAGDDGPELVSFDPSGPGRWQRLWANVASVLRPFEPSARVLTWGVLGLLIILMAETLAVVLVLANPLIEAFYAVTKATVTVGPNPAVDTAPGWFKLFAAVLFLAALGFTAVFTAGVVDRLLDRRLTTIIGQRVVPRKGHVVVVGLSQVGLRLCLVLRDLGLPVLAVDYDPGNYNVERAKAYGLPVVIGRGRSRFMLRRLALGRARALAAVTTEEVENIAVAVAALRLEDDLRVVLQAGRGEVANQTRVLFEIGHVRDVYRIGGTVLAAVALGSEAQEGFLHEDVVYLVGSGGEIEPYEPDVQAGARDLAAADGASAEEAAKPTGARV